MKYLSLRRGSSRLLAQQSKGQIIALLSELFKVQARRIRAYFKTWLPKKMYPTQTPAQSTTTNPAAAIATSAIPLVPSVPLMPAVVMDPPIFSLTSDILYTIFYAISNEAYSAKKLQLIQTPTCVVDKYDYPRKLAHICRRWRLMAINSPALWTDITFQNGGPYEEQTLWMERSQNAGLNVTVAMQNIRCLKVVARVLRPHIRHWKSLTVTPPGSSNLEGKFFRMFMDQLQHVEAPMLEVLNIVHGVEGERWKLRPFGGGTPRLRELKIGWTRFDPASPVFTGLRKLHIRPSLAGTDLNVITSREILSVLSQSAATLEDFFYEDSADLRPTSSPPPPPVYLPNLIQFRLSTSRTNSAYPSKTWVQEVYAGIQAPQIHTHDFHPIVLDHLTNVVGTRPFSGLRKLRLKLTGRDRDMYFPKDTFYGVFAALSGLQWLEVTDVASLDPQLFGSLCPKLESLNIQISDVRPLEKISLKKMVEARKARRKIDSLTFLSLTHGYLPGREHPWLYENLKCFFYVAPIP